MSVFQSRDIHDGWSFRRTDKPDAIDASSGELGHGDGFEVQEFPTTVHVELLKRKLIPDPVCIVVYHSPLNESNLL